MSIYIDRGLLLYCCFVAAMLGAVMGSFLHCAAYRIAHGESFAKGRSHCPDCGHVLGAGDLIPVLSWVFLKGRCRYCGKRIHWRYPLSEAVFALLTVLCLLRFDLSVTLLRNWGFLCCLYCLALVDLESYIIPDGCLLTGAALWLLALPFLRPGWSWVLSHAAAVLLYGGGFLGVSLVMDKLLKRESLGGGDIKLFALVGLYLGLAGTLLAVLLACVLGLCLSLVRRKENGMIPFGPAIAAAAALTLLYGDGVVGWYLGLLGL